MVKPAFMQGHSRLNSDMSLWHKQQRDGFACLCIHQINIDSRRWERTQTHMQAPCGKYKLLPCVRGRSPWNGWLTESKWRTKIDNDAGISSSTWKQQSCLLSSHQKFCPPVSHRPLYPGRSHASGPSNQEHPASNQQLWDTHRQIYVGKQFVRDLFWKWKETLILFVPLKSLVCPLTFWVRNTFDQNN